MTKINNLIKKKALIVISLIFFPFIVVYVTLKWLDSVEANLTLKVIVPLVFAIFTVIGVIFVNNLIKVFLFRRKGVKGYKIRAKITSYFLLTVFSSIFIFSGLMFYLIFLLESTFIEEEKKVSDNLLLNYRVMFEHYKKHYENNIIASTNDLGSFELVLKPRSNLIVVERNLTAQTFSNILLVGTNLSQFFYSSDNRIFYSDVFPGFIFVKIKDSFYGNAIPKSLSEAIPSIRKNEESLVRIRKLRRLIFPVSLSAVLILSIPILMVTLFVSLRAAKNLTDPIEKLLKGTRFLASGHLDYRVKVKSGDELEDLAENFNFMAKSLQEAYQKIKRIERIEAWQEVARKLAHEIKNPLTPIKLSAERLLYAYEKNQPNFSEILNKTAQTIIDETKRIENLLNEFSMFVRLPPLKKQNKDIIRTISEIIEFFRNSYPEYSFETHFPYKEFFLSYDEDKIKQLIFNIIKNAIEAESEIKKISIRLEVLEDTVRVYFDDFGSGVPKEIEDEIFTPYFTTKKNGSGIGLTLSEMIVSEHNGKIGFFNRDNGCTFFFELPIYGEEYERSSSGS